MTGSQKNQLHVPVHPARFVTAAALFDGHDAAINIMRRILQAQGAEVVHLGHDRSVREVVDAVLEEDAQGVAVSSYQGGHVEYFEYLAQLLAEAGAGHVRIFGGGGGVIVPDEIARLSEAGVRIFSPEDGQQFGLPGMINQLIRDCDTDLADDPAPVEAVLAGERRALARAITCLQAGRLPEADREALTAAAASRRVPVLGITGTGGSGKSSLTDELVRRLRTDQQDKLRVAVLAVDPTHRRSGGALLGDRIRMNALDGDHLFFRSLATRGAHELPDGIEAIVGACQAAGYDLVILETPGIGQGDAAVVPLADVSLYVMTPEFGAASQLEKIDMLDFADVVAINKFERRGGADALRDVSRQLIRNREAFGARPEDMPVFGTSAATFNDNGVTALYQHAGPAAGRPWPAPRRGCAAGRGGPDVHRRGAGHPAVPDRVHGRDRRDRAGLPRGDRPAGGGGPPPAAADRGRRRAGGRGNACDGTGPRGTGWRRPAGPGTGGRSGRGRGRAGRTGPGGRQRFECPAPGALAGRGGVVLG